MTTRLMSALWHETANTPSNCNEGPHTLVWDEN